MGQAVHDYTAMDNDALAACVRGGDRDAFRALMQRFNQRLFRVARAVVGDDHEAEDVLQESYLRAFAGLRAFRGESGLLTWLTAITLNEARTRLRRRRRMMELTLMDTAQSQVVPFRDAANPETEAGRQEARRLLELAIDRLPPDFRVVFVLREIEGCDVEEAAAQLEINPQTVKTRLHRARRLLRRDLQRHFAAGTGGVFTFLGSRCAGIIDCVMIKIAAGESTQDQSDPA